jgi:hypothetical protein
MTPGNGSRPPSEADKGLGDIVAEVSEKASLLVREEVELAKAEVSQKLTRLARGGAIGVVAGSFLLFALIMFLEGLAWFFNDLFDVTNALWVGFAMVMGILVVLGVVAGLVARRLLRRGSPPTPDLAIEEARKTRAELEHQTVQRDQVGRTLDKGEQLEETRG